MRRPERPKAAGQRAHPSPEATSLPTRHVVPDTLTVISTRLSPAPAPAGIDREAVRKMMFDFAADITAAEDTSGVVKVLAALDDYIDRIG